MIVEGFKWHANTLYIYLCMLTNNEMLVKLCRIREEYEIYIMVVIFKSVALCYTNSLFNDFYWSYYDALLYGRSPSTFTLVCFVLVLTYVRLVKNDWINIVLEYRKYFKYISKLGYRIIIAICLCYQRCVLIRNC